RINAQQRVALAEQVLAQTIQAREEASLADREAATAEAEANRGWREAAAELDALREAYEQDDRLRGELNRRIEEAERLLREGHELDPEQALEALAEEDTVEALAKRSDLAQRRLALLG